MARFKFTYVVLLLLNHVHRLAAMEHPPAPYRPAMRRTLQTCDPGNQCLTLTGHTDRVFAVAVFPDGLSVLTGSYDRTAAVWGPSQAAPLFQPRAS